MFLDLQKKIKFKLNLASENTKNCAISEYTKFFLKGKKKLDKSKNQPKLSLIAHQIIYRKIQKFPNSRQNSQIFCFNDYLFIYGGLSTKVHRDLWSYHINDRMWYKIGKLQRDEYLLGLHYFNQKAFVFVRKNIHEKISYHIYQKNIKKKQFEKIKLNFIDQNNEIIEFKLFDNFMFFQLKVNEKQFSETHFLIYDLQSFKIKKIIVPKNLYDCKAQFVFRENQKQIQILQQLIINNDRCKEFYLKQINRRNRVLIDKKIDLAYIFCYNTNKKQKNLYRIFYFQKNLYFQEFFQIQNELKFDNLQIHLTNATQGLILYEKIPKQNLQIYLLKFNTQQIEVVQKKFRLKLNHFAINYCNDNFYIFGGLSTLNRHFHNDILQLKFLDENKKFNKIQIHQPLQQESQIIYFMVLISQNILLLLSNPSSSLKMS